MLTASQAADKWARRLKGSTQDIQDGVNGVTVAPSQKAAAASSKWQQNVASAAAKSRFENGLKGVSLQDWKDKMINLGLPRIAAGADAGQPKFQSFASDFLPFLAGVQAKVQSMPNLTIEDSINRMTAQIRGVAAYQKKS